ncbi:glycosyltransferase family 2 protein [Nocardioides sp. GY 10127]|uniref:glycosyltransferase n=1 Tax=Nocardioides sp. GY 10127 TaxID=2569762 RepID=UPI0010A7D49D|nr:glycosyltransferase family 2 protein [Nocardioides sp. GY 10127]TIC80022.1 glycosyltransferase family 2 protein [Nocardioides sp. GY 10127]
MTATDAPDVGAPGSPEAVADHYRSVDSAPARYALDRPARAANQAVVLFLALSVLGLLAMAVAMDAGWFRQGRDLVWFTGADPGGPAAQVPARVFVLTFYVAVVASLATTLGRRLVMAAQLVGGFLLVCLAIDLVALAVHRALGVGVDVQSQQVLAALAGMALFPVVVLANAQLPPEPAARSGTRRPGDAATGRIAWHAWVRLGVALLVAFVGAALALVLLQGVVAWARQHALLGGVGPGLFLVQQVFAVVGLGFGLLLVRRSRRASFSPPVGVLVPAHNEAHLIAATIAAVDTAAAAYAGPVHLYVVDNASTDTTATVALEAIAACTAMTGEVTSCREPGKAVALNQGLSRVREPFVARIDADTLVGERCLDLCLRHFSRPDVGAVGGLPLPTGRRSFFDRVRLVEVLVRHGFFQVALMGFDGVVGEPGMFVVYRAEALRAVGPIVQGMNGEDTDICLRMGAAGYRSLSEPRASYASETPQSWAHLREQRVRWFRSIYHVTSHNRSAVLGRTSMAGAVVLPFQLLNAAHRAMLLPLLLFALVLEGVFSGPFAGLRWQPVAATVLGLPMLVAIGVCLAWRRPLAVLYVPEYLFFRLVRSYFTLAAVLSLVYPPVGRRGRPGRTVG